MKKMLSVLLALAMVFALAACGNSSAPANSSTPADNPPPAESTTPGDDVDASQFDTIQFVTSTGYNETDYSGSLVGWFADYLEEHSGGAVTMKIYYGGSFCSMPENYDYLQSGDITISIVQPVYAMNTMPFAFGLASYISLENAVGTANSLIYDNEETAKLIQDQAAQYNCRILGHTASGASYFLAKNEIKNFEDCAKYTIGSPINLEIYQGYGMGTVAVEPGDMYDSLSRGVCDMIAYASTDIKTAKLYEVANNAGDPRAYFTNQIIAVNLDTWNSLNEATQQLLIDAALALGEYSCSYAEELANDLNDTLIAEGGTYNLFPEEEGRQFIQTSMNDNAALMLGICEQQGCADGMKTIIQAWFEGLQLELPDNLK